MLKFLLLSLFLFVSLNADYKDGEAIFKNKCSSCHGNFIAINTLKENFFEYRFLQKCALFVSWLRTFQPVLCLRVNDVGKIRPFSMLCRIRWWTNFVRGHLRFTFVWAPEFFEARWQIIAKCRLDKFSKIHNFLISEPNFMIIFFYFVDF